MSVYSPYITHGRVFARLFSHQPPARVSVQGELCREGLQLKIDFIAVLDFHGRDTGPVPCESAKSSTDIAIQTRHAQHMHVQGVSHWAPANIGPYSQAVKVDSLLLLAGQIGLYPPTMILPKTFSEQVYRGDERTGHVKRVA